MKSSFYHHGSSHFIWVEIVRPCYYKNLSDTSRKILRAIFLKSMLYIIPGDGYWCIIWRNARGNYQKHTCISFHWINYGNNGKSTHINYTGGHILNSVRALCIDRYLGPNSSIYWIFFIKNAFIHKKGKIFRTGCKKSDHSELWLRRHYTIFKMALIERSEWFDVLSIRSKYFILYMFENIFWKIKWMDEGGLKSSLFLSETPEIAWWEWIKQCEIWQYGVIMHYVTFMKA